MGRGGSVLRRFALVIVTAIGIAGATVVVPAAATAATAYFSEVKTVKVAITNHHDASLPAGGWTTAWCPTGYKVTGGGFDLRDPYWPLLASTPTSNSSGRQGWRIRFDDAVSGEEVTAAYVYAQCVR